VKNGEDLNLKEAGEVPKRDGEGAHTAKGGAAPKQGHETPRQQHDSGVDHDGASEPNRGSVKDNGGTALEASRVQGHGGLASVEATNAGSNAPQSKPKSSSGSQEHHTEKQEVKNGEDLNLKEAGEVPKRDGEGAHTAKGGAAPKQGHETPRQQHDSGVDHDGASEPNRGSVKDNGGTALEASRVQGHGGLASVEATNAGSTALQSHSAEDVARARKAVDVALAYPPHANTAYDNFVYILWSENANALSQVAHRNFETLLSFLPNAQYRYFMYAPIEAAGYRISDGPSKVQFQRYSKRGYDVYLRLVNSNWGPYWPARGVREGWPDEKNVGEDAPETDRPGALWWYSQRTRFPYSDRKHSHIESVQPHPRDSFFNAIVHMYLTGGVYTDLTVAFSGLNTTSTEAGYAMYGDGCERRDVSPDEIIDEFDGWDVSLPMVFQFPEAGHPALKCVLQKYDKIVDHRVERKLDHMERFCLAAQPADKLTFSFYHPDEAEEGAASEHPPKFRLKMLRPGHGACARYLLENCIDEVAAQAPDSPPLRPMPMEWLGCDDGFHWNQWRFDKRTSKPFQALVEPESFDAASVAGVWTGAAFHGKRWDEPAEGHFISEKVYQTHPATRWDAPALRAALIARELQRVAPNHAVADAGRALGEEVALPSCATRLAACNPFFDHPDYFNSKGPYQTWSDKPQRSPVNAANARCSPTLVIPGAEKAASTFIYSLLAEHPQLISPLKGAGFKESGAYLNGYDTPRTLWEKVNRFPLIREDEPFVTGDATVVNMMDKVAAKRVKLDQPNARIIFSLRNPVDRLWSAYRFAYKLYYKDHLPQLTYPNVTMSGVDTFAECMTEKGFGAPAGEASTTDEEIDAYFNCRGSSVDPYKNVWKGVYYYPVLQWMRVLGKENVMVVSYEELTRDTKNLLPRLLEFVGLCSEGVDLDAMIAATRANKTPKKRDDMIEEHGSGRTPESVKAVKDFFAPWNERLYELTGERFPWDYKE